MKRVFAVVFMLLAGLGVASAQVVSENGGAIAGDITDSTGAKVSGATVTLSSPDTGVTKIVKTDASGFYSVGPIAPGNYKLKVEANGFETLEVQTAINLGTATPGTFKLTIGSSKETIEVVTGTVQVDTDQAGVSDVLTTEQLKTLPVNGRNFLDLAQIEPGVILQAGSTFDPTKAGYSAISVSGVSGRTTRILLDGQDITDETVGTTIMNVSEGAIGEFQLNRSTQDASGEVTSTGQVLVSTQSGTNKIHGMGFYNFQDARALFADANVNSINTSTGAALVNPYYQRNQFGGSIGGPILKDKLFLFANSERIKQTSQTPANLGTTFAAINSQFANISTPYKLTYSTGRMDYNGPLGGHYFVRGAYNVDAADRNPSFYELYTNRDNTYGIAGGADFQHGNFTHSFRVSYEKFHNFIIDHTQGNSSIYDPIAGFTLSYASNIAFGPNGNVPQATYQSDKQFRYDGSWIKGQHIMRFGYSLNRILGGGFFAADSMSPSDTITASTALNGTVNASNPNGYGCYNPTTKTYSSTACLGDPLNGYDTSALTLGNGLGAENEFPGFGLANGGQFDWREGAYAQDNWKVTPSFTFTAGLRWSVDTGRANQDLNPLHCSDLNLSPFAFNGTTAINPCGSPSTPLYSLWNPSYTGKVHQPYANIAPQMGFAYAPGNHKTVLRAGAGIFYESDVFNNASNARTNDLKPALGFATLRTACSSYSINLPSGTVVNGFTGSGLGTVAQTNPLSFQSLCHDAVEQAAPYWVQLQQAYQANQAANPTLNGAFIGNTLTVSGQYAPNYKTPYGEQYNFGVQRELHRGTILSVDYVHNSTIHIGETLDQNHDGAARTFNVTNAEAAVAATLSNTCSGAASVQAAMTPGGCPGGSGGTTGAKFATITDFAKNGLDRGTTFLGGNPASYAQKSVTGNTTVPAGAAFPGVNPALGTGSFIAPIGRSGYDALQMVFKQQAAHPAPGIVSSNVQVSYSLSRIVATTTSADEFFSPAVLDNDNPSEFMGRSANDHKHEVSFAGSFLVKHGPRVGLIGHFFSAPPSTLTLDTEQATGGVFQTDVTGDGTVGDVAPGTAVGGYMHSIKPSTLKNYITNFNSSIAGTLTPAGQAVVNGLTGQKYTITQAQLIQLGGAIQPIAQVAQANGGVPNPTFRQMDGSVTYPVALHKLPFLHGLSEAASLEPGIAFYNLGNFSNFTSDTATLQNSTTATCSVTAAQAALGYSASVGTVNTCPGGGGFITGVNNLAILASKRTVRNIGTFAQGAQRTAEFQLMLNW